MMTFNWSSGEKAKTSDRVEGLVRNASNVASEKELQVVSLVTGSACVQPLIDCGLTSRGAPTS